MFDLLLALVAAVCTFFRCRADTALEVLALRQQLATLKPKCPTAVLESARSGVLDPAATGLAPMEGGFDHREARDRGRLASDGVPSLVALALLALLWSGQTDQRHQECHSANGG